MTTTTRPTVSPLDLDVCDKCGSRGRTRYVLANGLDLVLCTHHSDALAVDLALAGITYDAFYAVTHA